MFTALQKCVHLHTAGKLYKHIVVWLKCQQIDETVLSAFVLLLEFVQMQNCDLPNIPHADDADKPDDDGYNKEYEGDTNSSLRDKSPFHSFFPQKEYTPSLLYFYHVKHSRQTAQVATVTRRCRAGSAPAKTVP